MRDLFRATIAAAVLAIGGAFASAGPVDWDGTWVGGFAARDGGAQIIIAGGKAIGFYWREDYVEATSAISADGNGLTLRWAGGDALLTRTGPEAAKATIHEAGKAEFTLLLKRE